MDCTITGTMTVTPPLTNAEEKVFLMKFSTIEHHEVINEYDITDNRCVVSTCNWIPSLSSKSYLTDDVRGYTSEVTSKPEDICFAITDDIVNVHVETEVKWLEYIIEHFIGDNPKAKNKIHDDARVNATLFDINRKCNGEFLIRSSDGDWRILITDNVVTLQQGKVIFN